MTSDWQTERVWQRWLDEYYQTHLRPKERIDAIAKINFLTPEEGGRATPVAPGYWASFTTAAGIGDARYTFADDLVSPGETIEAILQVLSPQAHQGRIRAGMEFLVREGNKTVARGCLTWVDGALEEQNS